MTFVCLVIGAFALLWFLLVLYDRVTTTRWRRCAYTELLRSLLNEAKPPPGTALSVDEVQDLASALRQPPKGIQGLTRTLLALGLLTLVGVALVALLVGNGSNASELLKTVVTALTTALITIIGFYFGAKTAEGATASSKATAKPTAPSVKPQIALQPSDQTVNIGATATFLAEVTGHPQPAVQWQVSTTDEPAFTDIPGATSTTYTVTDVRPRDTGNRYRAAFVNHAGTTTTRPATLTVTE